MKSSFDQMRTSWKQAAATPAGRPASAWGLQAGLESTKQAMAAYGCEW
jgi:hypothetical protein